ncbi:disulfide bond formation protein B [Methylophaga sp. 42_25_T18]|nr:disulfide bond formation protein B [Methylophaga sp. 42_25_T18]OUR88618.1 disulfide bond formation protein B [Methylophaga sp. 42_8_T64]
MLFSSRTVFILGFLFCLSMLSVAGYFQFVEHFEPCPLCILQRVAILIIGLVFLLAAIHDSTVVGVRVYGGLITLFSLLGGSISAWHVRLQNLPADQVPSCGPGLNFMLDNFPLSEAISMVLRGSGECAEVLWTFIGLSIPAWTLIAFVALLLVGLTQLFKKASNELTWI